MTDIKDINTSPGVQDIHQTFHHSGNLPDAGNKYLQLAGLLQSTLELQQILEMFDREISSIFPHDGLSYENNGKDYTIQFGKNVHHRCSFELVLMEENIGILVFYRNSKFTDNDIKQLETMIAALIYPLRNALLYKAALEIAHRDPVTGVNNRTALDRDLDHEVNLAKRHTVPLSMIILDLDDFKNINDSYGHIAGDAILGKVAYCITECVRGSDIVYRFGGEEFIVVLRNTRNPGAKMLAERIRKAVEKMLIDYEDISVRITVSAGLSSFRSNDTVKSFLERCDAALYEAKKKGKNCVVVAE